MTTTHRIICVGSTGRDAGKTTTTCSLARALVAAGHSVLAIKAIEPWCDGGFMDIEDGQRLANATGQSDPPAALVRIRGRMPLPLAVETFRCVDWDQLVARIRRYSQQVEYTLVEGVAHLLTPLTFEHDLPELANTLGAPVLLVSGDHSNEVAHSLAARLALSHFGVPLLGQVVNVTKQDHYTGYTEHILQRLTGDRNFVTVPPIKSDVEGAKLPAYATIRSWIAERAWT